MPDRASRRLRFALEVRAVRMLLPATVLLALGVLFADRLPDALDELPSLPERQSSGSAQSAAQISSAEFAQIRAGLSPRALRDLVGKPAAEEETELEGLRLECLSYGIVSASGIYQFCFANGKLASKLRFGTSQ
jgi:hypothetical protein